MKQINTRKSTGFSAALKKGAGFFKKTALASICFLGLAVGASAQIYTDGFEGATIGGSTANSGGATGNANLGIALSGWTTTAAFTHFAGTSPTAPTSLALNSCTPTTTTWELTVPISGCFQANMTGMTFDYDGSSATLSYGNLTVLVNGTPVDLVTLTNNSSFHHVIVPAFSVTATGSIVIDFVWAGGSHGASSTNRLDNVNILGTVTGGVGSCSAVATGTVTPGTTTVCGGAGSAIPLTLTGATVGCGITYQWQSSPVGGSFTPIMGATNASFTTAATSPTVATTTLYECITTCTVSSLTATSNVATVTVNPVPAIGAITGLNHPLLVGGTTTLGTSIAGGVGSVTFFGLVTPSTAVSVDALSGIVSGLTGGTADVLVQRTAGGCTVTVDSLQDVAWPNTLALYAGTNGTSTHVIGIAGETVGALTPVGFGSNGSCTTGGFSGMTVPTTVVTYDPIAGPHVEYKIKPNPGKALNVFSIHASTRESNTGTTEARIAYSRDGGLTWTAENQDEAQIVGGSCGANSTSWFWNDASRFDGPTINGIKDSIIVAVFPFASGSNSGTFQLNSLEVYGVVTDSAMCLGTLTNGGSALPAFTTLCDSGFRTISIDSNVFSGTAGQGITYQWDSSSDNGANYFPIVGATNTSYTTTEIHSTDTHPTILYKLITTCTATGSTVASTVATVTAVVTPTGLAINNVPTGPLGHLTINTPRTLTETGGTGSIWWSSNDTSVSSIDSLGGVLHPHLPGDAVITVHVVNNGCTGILRDTVNVIDTNTLVAYIGKNGTSTAITNYSAGAVTVSTDLVTTGYGSTTPCSNGGLSGLTNDGSTMYSFAGANTSFTVTPTGTNKMIISGFHTTLRSSTQGIQNVRLVYSADGGATWVDEGADQTVAFDDCGYSHMDNYWSLVNPSAASDLGTIINGPAIFRIYGFNPAMTGGTLEINAIDITGVAAPACPGTITVGPILDSTHTSIDGNTYCDGIIGKTYAFTATNPGTFGFWNSDNQPQIAFDSAGTNTGVSFIFPFIMANPNVDITYSALIGGCLASTTAGISVASCPMKPTSVPTVNVADVQVYPNPAQMMLNVKAAETVNVTIQSMDGKTLIDQKDAKAINISKLASGIYMIKIYSTENALIKTAKFTKE